MAALIAAQRAERRIPHAVACRALGVSQSWFYKWKSGRPGRRAVRRDRLKAEVPRLFTEHEGKYGSPRLTADLRDAGWRVSENTVAGQMREQGLAARRKKKRKATTRPGHGRWRAPDLVKRDFPAAQLNRNWFGDGTQIATGEGRLHLVSVLDGPPAGCWGSPSASGTTHSWPTAPWRWRSRSAAGRSPAWCSTPTKPALPGRLGIAEVDRCAERPGDREMAGHLGSLVPGDRPQQPLGQVSHPGHERVVQRAAVAARGWSCCRAGQGVITICLGYPGPTWRMGLPGVLVAVLIGTTLFRAAP